MDIETLKSRHPDHWMRAAAIRALTLDAVAAANSGHSGMPMGMADVATVLFEKHLKFDPKAPRWPDRDRFILSAGHGSMLIYSLLYLTGYADVTLEQIKNFRHVGDAAAALGRWDDALDAYGRARSMIEGIRGKQDVHVAALRAAVAVVAARRARWADVATLTSAILRDAFADDAGAVLDKVHYWHGVAQAKLGRRTTDAMLEARSAATRLVANPRTDPVFRALLTTWLLADGTASAPTRASRGR